MLVVSPYISNGFDSDTITYINAVEGADNQTLEWNTRMAFDRFVRGCKDDGIWDAIDTSCILAGARTLDGALTPLKGTAPTNYKFLADDYNRKIGLKGNGVDKYLNTNKVQNSNSNTSVHISVYTGSVRGSANETLMGVIAFAATSAIDRIFPGDNINFRCNSPTPITVPYSAGFQGVTRGDASNITKRSAGVSTASASTAGTMGLGTYKVFSINGSTGFSGDYIGFYSIGSNINLALLDTRVTKLITDINNAF